MICDVSSNPNPNMNPPYSTPDQQNATAVLRNAMPNFNQEVDTMLAQIRSKIISQFERNIEENGMKAADARLHAKESGLASGIAACLRYDPTTVAEIAAKLLEEVNLHTEAAAVRA